MCKFIESKMVPRGRPIRGMADTCHPMPKWALHLLCCAVDILKGRLVANFERVPRCTK